MHFGNNLHLECHTKVIKQKGERMEWEKMKRSGGVKITLSPHLEDYPVLKVPTCNIPKGLDVCYELFGKLGEIRFWLNANSLRYGIQYNRSMWQTGKYSYDYSLRLECQYCTSLTNQLIWYSEWRCPNCLFLPSLLAAQKQYIGKAALSGDRFFLESLLQSPDATKKSRGLMALSMLGLSSSGLCLPLKYDDLWEISRIY